MWLIEKYLERDYTDKEEKGLQVKSGKEIEKNWKFKRGSFSSCIRLKSGNNFSEFVIGKVILADILWIISCEKEKNVFFLCSCWMKLSTVCG